MGGIGYKSARDRGQGGQLEAPECCPAAHIPHHLNPSSSTTRTNEDIRQYIQTCGNWLKLCITAHAPEIVLSGRKVLLEKKNKNQVNILYWQTELAFYL